jgi:hypothetical protein
MDTTMIKAEEIIKHQTMMFGMPLANVVAEKPDFYTPIAWATTILSDAQESMEHGCLEMARQYINVAKFWMNEGGK